MRVGCYRKIGPGHVDTVFGKVDFWFRGIFPGGVSFHGSVPIHVYVANDESGNNVMGELRMTQNRIRSVRPSPGWSKILRCRVNA